jgi:predicted transcriptional regulator
LNYTQDRDEFGTTQQEREIAKLLGVDKLRQIDIAKEQGISRQRVGQLKESVISKKLINLNGSGYVITDYGKQVLGMNVEELPTAARTSLDKKFDKIIAELIMSDEIATLEEE